MSARFQSWNSLCILSTCSSWSPRLMAFWSENMQTLLEVYGRKDVMCAGCWEQTHLTLQHVPNHKQQLWVSYHLSLCRHWPNHCSTLNRPYIVGSVAQWKNVGLWPANFTWPVLDLFVPVLGSTTYNCVEMCNSNNVHHRCNILGDHISQLLGKYYCKSFRLKIRGLLRHETILSAYVSALCESNGCNSWLMWQWWTLFWQVVYWLC